MFGGGDGEGVGGGWWVGEPVTLSFIGLGGGECEGVFYVVT